MISIFDELQASADLISIIVGFQISTYFFIQYFKNRHKDLKLNDVILAFASFYTIITISLFLKFLIFDIMEFELKKESGAIRYSFLTIAIIIYLLIIAKRKLTIIMDKRTNRILISLLLINYLIMIIAFENYYYIYFILLTIIMFFSIIFSQYNLIKNSANTIRKKFIILFFGQLFLSTSLMFFNNPFKILFNEEIISISIFFFSLLIIGALLIIFGGYRFPIYFDFRWKENILKLYIFHENTKKILFQYDFQKNKFPDKIGNNKEEKESLDLIAYIIPGIEKITSKGLNNKNQMEIIKHGEFVFFIEYGDKYLNSHIIFALISKKELENLKYLLKSIKEQFQGYYYEILKNLDLLFGYEKEIFLHFNNIIKELIK
ncbi:MAG: hypothetical protein ACTSQP_13420 [Promethearchaeota archaeon]